MVKAYSYIRFSTPEQAKGDSFRRQIDGAREFAREHGLELDEGLRDLGISAYRGGHAKTGALARFVALVDAGTVAGGSYLIVESLDRLSREEVIDAASRLLALINAGVHVVTLSDRQIYSRDSVRDNWTLLVLSLSVMARAHEESRTKGMRVGRAWAEKRRKALEEGQAMTSIAPAWLRLVGGPREGHYELIPERADIVRGMFRDTIAGIGRRGIAHALNEIAAGDPSAQQWGIGKKRGQRWHDSYIAKILGNHATFGEFESLGKSAGGTGAGAVLIRNYYPAVISETTFYQAQAAIGTRRSGYGRPSKGHRNLLRGLAKCAKCGSNLVIVDKGVRSSGPKLICGRAHASAGCDRRTYYPYARLENVIIIAIGREAGKLIASNDDIVSTMRAEHAAIGARGADTQRRLNNLLEAVAAGAGGKTLVAQIIDLERRLDDIDAAKAKLEREIKFASVNAPAKRIGEMRAVYNQFREVEGDELGQVRALVHQRLVDVIEKVQVSSDRADIHLRGSGIVTVFGDLTSSVIFMR